MIYRGAYAHLYKCDLSYCFQPFSDKRSTVSTNLMMKLGTLYRFTCSNPSFRGKSRIVQCRSFQHDFVPRDPSTKPKRYKYPEFYDPYGPRPPPSDKIVKLAERIISLPPEERMQIAPALRDKLMLPKLQPISVEGMDLSTQGGARSGSAKAEEKKPEKTTFDVKLEKFDAVSKLKVIKEIRSFTDLGLKEAKDLVEKAPVVLKQQITKDEANSIIEKIKAVGGVAVVE